jgi:glutathione S-transferase
MATTGQPHYKLTYFNLRARGELPRLLFAAAGVEYEDIRIEHSRWPELKPETPFGQLPVLEVDGVKICQSMAISRYLAAKFGFAGQTEFDRARVDMIVECLNDAVQAVLTVANEKDSAKQATLQKRLDDEQLPDFMARFDKLLAENSEGKSEYFVGNSLTLADIAFANGYTWMILIGFKDPLVAFPKLKALVQRVESVPRIAEWLKKRPTTPL